jgi:hypothetical protein
MSPNQNRLMKIKNKKDKKYAYHPRFNLIEHKLMGEVECILTINHTKHIGKQYLVKWKGCHPKESQWMKLGHLDHLPEMVDEFEQTRGHEIEK